MTKTETRIAQNAQLAKRCQVRAYDLFTTLEGLEGRSETGSTTQGEITRVLEHLGRAISQLENLTPEGA